MEAIQKAIFDFFTGLDWWYVWGIIFAGKFLTNDSLIKSFPIKATLQRVAKSLRVAVISIFLGVIIFILRDYHHLNKMDQHAHIETMMHSFFFANGMYALLMQFVFNIFKRKDS
jgi:hypothetical protein